MLEFTKDIREAGLIYEEYGYVISAVPAKFGKINELALSLKGYKSSFPADKLNPKCSILLNHYLSKTVALDVDDYEKCFRIFKDFNIDLDELIASTTTFQGQQNHYKLIYNRNFESNLGYKTIFSSDGEILSFKGCDLCYDLTLDNADFIGNYLDHLPPSVNPPVTYMGGNTMPEIQYKFITPLLRRDELPNMPSEVIDMWKNFDNLKERFNNIINFRDPACASQ
jgi:hypothetical protein